MGWESANCYDCLNYRSIDTGEIFCKTKEGSGFGCTIADMFELYQDKMTEDMRYTLLPDYECPMRLTEMQARLRQKEIYKRIAEENAQLRNGFMQQRLFGEKDNE